MTCRPAGFAAGKKRIFNSIFVIQGETGEFWTPVAAERQDNERLPSTMSNNAMEKEQSRMKRWLQNT